MNFYLKDIPQRTEKNRTTGLTMVMDKGLSVRQAEDLMESSHHLIDIVKLGFGTSYMTNSLKEKIRVYQKYNANVYLGGTLFEAFLIRNQLDDYRALLEDLQLTHMEISDGSMFIDLDKKCELIKTFSKDYTVFSEVGSKDANVTLADETWVENMGKELAAGAFKVIAEARESGNVGIYDDKGNANEGLIEKLDSQVGADNILWEAPVKSQCTWLIKRFGTNVNLGNINHQEVIAVETLRVGLRGDTFHDFLSK